MYVWIGCACIYACACMHGCMNILHMCVHTCACTRMRICTFGNTPPPSIEVGRTGFGTPNIVKLPTPMAYGTYTDGL